MTALALAGDVRRKGALLAVSTLAFGLAVITLSLSSVFAISLAIMFLVGAAASLYDTSMWTVVQITASAEMRGRVMGLYMATFGLTRRRVMSARPRASRRSRRPRRRGGLRELNALRSLRRHARHRGYEDATARASASRSSSEGAR